ncbi:endolytic transglycosylase MltG [Saccharospirillum impatiens]|uniref:endolytic transglycosylase MltG n=1 Tax=Saccharospirillum impatiens TaxID=169438 RepID=UPI000419CDB9|nr:endolytic transglycosylase MltG [Saccharospirillum impatiens]
MIKRLIVIAVLLVFGAGFGAVFYIKDRIDAPMAFADPEHYTVPSGASLRRVLNDFEANGWIEYARAHELWLRYQEQTAIQRGEYRLMPGDTSSVAINRMIEGQKIQYSVQFIEGWTFRQFLTTLTANEAIKHTLMGMDTEAVLETLDIDQQHPEGWFFPDTYLFERGTSDVDILRRAHQRMQQELTQAWENRSETTQVNTPYEALILASIIERETGAAFERPQIAGVFSRRLAQNMRLQTDPTIIYGLGDDFSGNLTRSHLRQDTPYNTYTRSGLPPTPIANPGRGALEAAVDPAEGTTLFFVARGDGTHQFSDTYEQHNEAVRQYQRFQRRDDYRSAPPVDEQGDGS